MPLPDAVLVQSRLRAPKGIVYGSPGSGKTTFGASADRPLIVDCENGAAHVPCHRTPYLATWPEIQPWLDGLAAGGHEYPTVVIDSIDWLLRRVEEHVAGVDGTPTGMKQTLNRSHGGYGNGRQVLKNYVYQYLLPVFDRLVNSGVAVLLLAHAARRQRFGPRPGRGPGTHLHGHRHLRGHPLGRLLILADREPPAWTVRYLRALHP